MKNRLTTEACLPEDAEQAVLVGRVWSPELDGPTTVLVRRDGLCDLSRVAATSSQLFNLSDPATASLTAATKISSAACSRNSEGVNELPGQGVPLLEQEGWLRHKEKGPLPKWRRRGGHYGKC